MRKYLTLWVHALTYMAVLTAAAKDELIVQTANTYIHDVDYTIKTIFLSNLDTTSVPEEQCTSDRGYTYGTYKFSDFTEIELTNFHDSETGIPCAILTGQGVIKAYSSYQSLTDPGLFLKAHLNIVIAGDQATGCRVYQIT